MAKRKETHFYITARLPMGLKRALMKAAKAAQKKPSALCREAIVAAVTNGQGGGEHDKRGA